jgi:hypothetical protein
MTGRRDTMPRRRAVLRGLFFGVDSSEFGKLISGWSSGTPTV